MVENYEERRAHRRFELADEINLKIVFSSENPGLLGRTLDGSTLDVSAGGLRILLNHPIKVDSVLDVWVTLKEQRRKFFLTGNVRWCNESDKPGIYQVGLILRERTDTVTDLRSWQETFK
ncbi:MAG: PilZ protein [Pseudomonadota bacterium]|nr:PilZ protein [Pseudomonadota bacterium]